MGLVNAPWTCEQVATLNRYQREAPMHPFTCGSNNRMDAAHTAHQKESGDRDYGLLVATPDGWACPACDYTQTWAHDFMADPKEVNNMIRIQPKNRS